MTLMNDALRIAFEKATDSRNPLLTTVELDGLWEMTNHAMHANRYQEAFAGTEALLCQVSRGAKVSDVLPDPRTFFLKDGRTAEMIQGFVDRWEALCCHADRN